MAPKRMRPEVLFILACVFTLSANISRCQDAASEARAAAESRFAENYVHPPMGRFPYVCSIRPTKNRSNHVCGGILVRPRWVLTAAHCVDPNRDPTAGASPFLYCGIYDVEDENEEHLFYAVAIELREEWKGDPVEGYDIALLKLNRDADFITPRLANEDTRPFVADFLGGLGWGATASGGTVTSLQYVPSLRVIAYTTCNNNKQWDGLVDTDTMLCAGIGSSDACKGDSGGPLLQADSPGNDYKHGKAQFDLVYGIISFGDGGCGNSKRAGVYTYIGYFEKWILSVVEGTESPLPSHSPTRIPLPSPTPSPSPSPPTTPSPTPSPSPSPPTTPSPSPPDTIPPEEVIVAIENDDVAVVRAALQRGIDPNSRYNDTIILDGDADDTLLHWAARYDSSKSAKALIDGGADLEARNRYGNAPLHYCAIFDAKSVAEHILENGGDIDLSGNDGYTPIHYASQNGHDVIVEFLIKNGGDVGVQDDNGNTPLHIAAWRGHADVAEELIRAGADVDAVEVDGETPLHFAASYGQQSVVKVNENRLKTICEMLHRTGPC